MLLPFFSKPVIDHFENALRSIMHASGLFLLTSQSRFFLRLIHKVYASLLLPVRFFTDVLWILYVLLILTCLHQLMLVMLQHLLWFSEPEMLFDGLTRRGKDFSILTTSCLSSLSANGGLAGSCLRRLHIYNIEINDTLALHLSLRVCPSLVDLEFVGLYHVGVRNTLNSVSMHCPLLERFIFESWAKGRDDSLVFTTFDEFFLNCPNITALALKGFNLFDFKALSLVKGFHKLKYVDFSTSYSFTGSFLKNLALSGVEDHLEVIVLRDCMHLKQSEVKQFLSALVAGELKLLRHLDISNIDGLAYAGGPDGRLFDTSFIPTKQLLEQRPNFCLVARFPEINSELEQMTSDSSEYVSSGDESSGSEESNSVADEESADEQSDM